MLDTLTLQNFKSFKQLSELQIRPITVLTGTNSSGKSSILQSILLLKQTFESQNPMQTLLLNGRLVHLGAFENVVFDRNPGNVVVIDFVCTLATEDLRRRPRRGPPLGFTFREIFGRLARRLDYRPAQYRVRYSVSLQHRRRRRGRGFVTGAIVVSGLRCELATISGDAEPLDVSVELTRLDTGEYKILWNNIGSRFRSELPSSGMAVAGLEFNNLVPAVIRGHSLSLEEAARYRESEIVAVFRRVNDIMQFVFGSYAYLGPLREEPARRYIYEDEVVEIGIKGENAPYIFLTEQDKTLPDHYFFDAVTSQFRLKRRPKLGSAVKEWLTFMNIRDLRPETAQDIIYLNMRAGSASRTRVNIADVGFGVSQIFPIILEGLRMPPRDTLLLEQPEIHLHPNLQMQLADYFVALAMSNKRVIVETHSDHIINRLVRRIVEDPSRTLSDLVNIYFVLGGDNGAVLERVHIDTRSGIVNWPKDFFDQVATESEAILKAGLKKRQSGEQP
jgi:predicted ATPase